MTRVDVAVTERVRLRRCTSFDVEAVFAYRSRLDVARFLSAGVWTREKTERELAKYQEAAFGQAGDELVLLVETRDTNEVVGEVGLVWLDDAPRSAEIGYVFNPDFGGQGLATEAVAELIRIACEQYGFERVLAKADEANSASRALCERVGMRVLGTAVSDDHRRVRECSYGLERARG